MKPFLIAVAAALSVCSAQAQSPYLVTDLNTSYAPNAISSSPAGFVAAGSTVFFAGSSDATGPELFTTDGTTVTLVRDIVPGTSGSGPSRIVALNATTVIFAATDPTNGTELWKSDGSGAGTVLVKDICPGAQSSGPTTIAALNGRVFFLASETGQIGGDVWTTDGTDAGTVKIAAGSANINNFVVMNGLMYFYSGTTLWQSDGTAAGTTAVRTDLSVGAMTVAGNRLFMIAWNSTNGFEPWISDGTANGTTILKDINPGAASAFNSSGGITIAAVGSAVVFFAYEPVNGWSLWRSDGTANGTVPFVSYPTWPVTKIPPFLTAAGGLAFFSNNGVWRTDGTPIGTIKLGNLVDPSSFTFDGSRIDFFARDLSGQMRLCATDGSDANTVVVSRYVTQGGPVPVLRAVAGRIFFAGNDGNAGSEPWVSDGTENGTHQIANMMSDPPASSNPDFLRGVAGRVFFTAASVATRELWTSDGTAAGTAAVTNFGGTKTFDRFVPWNNDLFFTTSDSPYSALSLYLTDGNLADLQKIKTASIGEMFGSSGYFYFAAPSETTNSYYSDLWRSDGTVAGTIDLTAASAAKPAGPARFSEAFGHVFFEAGDPRGIWRTDGTPDSTLRLTTYQVPSYSYYVSMSSGLVAASGGLYYALSTATYGSELWRLDEQRLGTKVFDIRPGTDGSGPDQLTSAGPLVFFTADDGVHGREVWRTDGTTAGTFMLRDAWPGPPSSNPRQLKAVGSRVFWVANDGLDGYELWTSDGTTAGTAIVADIAAGAASSSPDGLVAADGMVWFSADDGITGRELWRSDGTAAGTQRVADLNPGTAGSDPRGLTVANRLLFFNAQTSVGRELWAVPLSATAYTIGDAEVFEGNSGTTPMHFKVTRIGDLSQTTTVQYATSDGTANAGADYVATTGTLTFAPGVAEAFIDVPVIGDTTAEPDKTLFVTLSAPSAGVLQNTTGTGVIRDDDRSASLSIDYVQTGSYSPARRTFVVSNSGPSDADNVSVRITDSPSIGTLTSSSAACTPDGYGALVCSLGSVLAGESRTIVVSRGSNSYAYDQANPPGFTVTGTVTASTIDLDMTDNTVSVMTTNDGTLVTPPFLTPSSTVTLGYAPPYTGYSQTVSVTSSNPGVTVTPASIALAANQQSASFTLQVGNIAPGTTKLSSNQYGNAMVVPIVVPPSTPRLDPAFVTTTPYSVTVGHDVRIAARVAARPASGAYPTGTLTLLDEKGNVIDQQPLDAQGSVTFVRTALPPATYNHTLRYDGDPNVNPLTAPIGSVNVYPYATTARMIAPPMVCGNTADVRVTISTTDTTQAPTGTITFTGGSQPVTVSLVPTGADGVAQATAQVPVTSTTTSIQATYTPTGYFGSTSIYGPSMTFGCAAMNLVATATDPNTVVLNWTGTGAATYEVYRASGSGSYGLSWSFLGYAGVTTYLDTNLGAGQSYFYRVRPSGGTLYSNPDLATTLFFTDDPIQPQQTTVKALHFTELLRSINSVRYLTGLPATTFASAPAAGNPITAAPLVALRNGLAEARLYLGLPAIALTDPSVSTGSIIKAAHIQELRDGTK